MKIERTFVVEEHEDYGETGYRPVDMPEADPLPGMTAAHDVLEHAPGDDGSIGAEFMALGAAYWLRGETGYMRNGDPEGNIAADFVELYRHFAHEGFPIGDPGEVPDHAHADTFARIARAGCRRVRGEHPEEREDLAAFLAHRWRIARWLLKGYAAAEERYEGVDAYTLAHEVFASIEERLDRALPDLAEGTRVRVAVDTDAMYAEIEAIHGDEHETDYCDECSGDGEVEAEFYDDCDRCGGEGFLTLAGVARTDVDCGACGGEGCVQPRVKCGTCDGEGEVSTCYREAL